MLLNFYSANWLLIPKTKQKHTFPIHERVVHYRVNERLTRGIVQGNSFPPQNHHTLTGYHGSWPSGCYDEPLTVCGSSWMWSTIEGLLLPHEQVIKCLWNDSLSVSLPPLLFLCPWEKMRPSGSRYTFIYVTHWTLQLWISAQCEGWTHWSLISKIYSQFTTAENSKKKYFASPTVFKLRLKNSILNCSV